MAIEHAPESLCIVESRKLSGLMSLYWLVVILQNRYAIISKGEDVPSSEVLKWQIYVAIITVRFSLWLTLFQKGNNTLAESHAAKVLLISFDTADPKLVEKWMDDGELPVFQGLRTNGLWAKTENPPRIYSGAAWPSFNTGLVPAHHGRYFYARLDGYRVHGYRPIATKGEPFWRSLSEQGKRVALIDIPYANAEESVNGIQIIDWLVHDRTLVPESQVHFDGDVKVSDYNDFAPPFIYCYPPELEKEVLEYGENRQVPAGELSGRSTAAFRRFEAGLVERITAKTNFCLDRLNREPWDLFMVCYHEPHDVGHECWHIHDSDHPGHDEEQAAVLGDPILTTYKALDDSVGRLIEQADDDTLVIVYSSHGMGPAPEGNRMLDKVLSRLEDQAAPGGLKAVDFLNRAWKSIPAPIRSFLSPLRNRFRKGVYESLVESTRGKRKCFAIPTNGYCGGVRINCVGREPDGQVQPGKEFEEFCEQLKHDLMELVDADTGEPAVREVVTSYSELFPRDGYTEDLYTGGFQGDQADVLIEWHARSFRALKSPKIGVVEKTSQSSRTGDHEDIGFIFASGPGLDGAELPDPVRVIDLAPTLAQVLGTSLNNADGEPLSALLGGLPSR